MTNDDFSAFSAQMRAALAAVRTMPPTTHKERMARLREKAAPRRLKRALARRRAAAAARGKV